MLPKYNAFQLKLFMAILMVFDHIDHIPGLLPIELAGVFHVLTRCVGVFFAFLAVDGFRYTHDRKRYVLRLFVWAAIMATGNTVYNLIAADPALSIHNNIFFPLALGVLMLCVLAGSGPLPLRICGVVFLVLFASIFAEGGIVVHAHHLPVPRPHPAAQSALSRARRAAVRHVLRPLPHPVRNPDHAGHQLGFMFPLVIPFLAMYDGTRGPKTAFSKYFFYVFYPLHLWIIGLIALLVR